MGGGGGVWHLILLAASAAASLQPSMAISKKRQQQHWQRYPDSDQVEFASSSLQKRHSKPAEQDSGFDEIRELPTFIGQVENKTVRASNAVILICQVKNLGNYKVAWVRVDTQTILTIHHHIITRNQRVSLSHHDNEIWRLHLEGVEEADRGWYMCQINTDPMRSQKGFLEVVVPPTIIDDRSSSDVVAKEGSPVNLSCEATGSPRPQLRWRRADGEMIRYQGGNVVSVEGNSLVISSASRAHIGTYYCIASNGVPPTKSKSIILRVQFAPLVSVQNQLEFAPAGHNITMSCSTEAFPPALHYWTFHNGSAISAGKKYQMQQKVDQLATHLALTITELDSSDFGTYYCVAKNSLGKQDGAIKLSERILPSTIGSYHLQETSTLISVRTSLPYGVTYDPFHPNQDVKSRNKERIRDQTKEQQSKSQKEQKPLLDNGGTVLSIGGLWSFVFWINYALVRGDL